MSAHDEADYIALTRLGRLAFGAEWKTPMAHLMGRRYRQVHRWSIGEQGVPAEVWTKLHDYIEGELRGMKGRKSAFEQALDECQRRGRV